MTKIAFGTTLSKMKKECCATNISDGREWRFDLRALREKDLE